MRAKKLPSDELVRYVAKVGFLRKPFWEKHFFVGKSRGWKHTCWKMLTDSGYFVLHPSDPFQQSLVLNRNHESVIHVAKCLPVRPPYMAQWMHDETLYRGILELERLGMLGDWQSELQLKSSVDNSDKGKHIQLKFPDAKVVFYGDSKLSAAIELERTLKTRRRYLGILRNYALYKDIEHVLWIVPDRTIAQSLGQRMDEVPAYRARYVNSFIEENSWVVNPKACVEAVLKTKFNTELNREPIEN